METVYISAALDENNPDIKAALKDNIPIKKRSDLLSELFHQYEYGIAIGGTSGKSTTTAMIGYIFDMLGKKPCLVNGAMLRNYEKLKCLPNFIYNQDKVCIIEVDESDGSIYKYHPNVGLVNNISHDHTSMDNLIQYFTTFAHNIKDVIVLNYDCEYTRNLEASAKKIFFSTKSDKADFYAYDIKCLPRGVEYSFRGQTFKLNLLGRFNVANTIAAIAVSAQVGINPFEAAKTLEGFSGVKRRLEIVGTTARDITLIDDFAHNPDKIGSSLTALKEYPNRLVVMYQSHSPFSAKNTGDEVAEAVANILGKDDIFIMPEVYMHNKETDIGITANNIINKTKEFGHKNSLFMENQAEIYDYILKNAKNGDLIIIMGARDNSLPDFSRRLLKELQ
jgi:UDP-N-acetylmuramate--alanine ligase